MIHNSTKHIDVKMHFIRYVIEQGAIVVKKIPIVDNPQTWWLSPLLQLSSDIGMLDLISVDSIWKPL